MNCDWWIPRNPDNPADWDAAERAMAFHCGWFKNPIFKNGDYPEVMKDYIARYSAAQGLSQSRLPEFTEEEKAMISGEQSGICGHLYMIYSDTHALKWVTL